MSQPDPTAHPRPLLRRPFTSLDGEWGFAADPDLAGTVGAVAFDRTIQVPYAPETLARLREVKRTWDPDNVFRFNHNIVPAL